MQEILQMAKKVAEEAEVFHVQSSSTPLKFEANRLKGVLTRESSSTALRLIKDGRLGFAQVSGAIGAEKLVGMAVETSRFGAEASFEFPHAVEYTTVATYDPATEKISINEMAQLGQQLIDKIKAHTPQVVCEANLSRGLSRVQIINSRGGQADYQKSYFSIGIAGVVVKDNDMLYVGDGRSSCRPLTDYKPLAEECITQLELARQNAAIGSGMLPVVFKPWGVASALISPLISAFNGKVVYNGASPLGDKLGSRLFDTKISLWDDATVPYAVGSAPCDDEGVAAGRTVLIEAGVVANFLYDLQTAGLAKTRSTGNGSRSGGLPSPAPSALIFGEGELSLSHMLADIKEGLLIYELMGATQGNILNGDFSGNVLLGYKIENGRLVGRVKDTMVSGNVYELLKEVTLGNDSRWVEGFLKTPSIFCPRLSVAARGG